ncbi:MAG TPA: HEAT repeat domain-containing protein [Verrucomicrobiae bacterium]
MLVLASIAATTVLWNVTEPPQTPSSDRNTLIGASPAEMSAPHLQTDAEVNGFKSNEARGELPQSVLLQLSDPDAKVRRSALTFLPVLTPPNYDVVPILTACLNDTDADVRATAAEQLSAMRMSAIAAVPKLKELAKLDLNERVQSRAKDALYNIRGYDFGLKDF